MKLLFFFTQQIAPNAGGVERVVTCMYNELNQRGYEITTLYLKPYVSVDAIPNQIQLPSENGESKENKEFVKRIIDLNHFDVSFNFGAIFNKSSRAFVEACYSRNLPTISVYHNTLDWILWINPHTHKLMTHKIARETLRKLYSIYQKFPFIKNARYISRKSAASVVLADCYKKEYIQLIDSSPHHLTAIYNPRISPELRYDSKWDKKKNEILFVGRLEEQKNLEELIHIWSIARIDGWKLIIVGDGSQKTQLETLIAKLNLSDSVCLLGHQNNPQTYYKRAKIFVMTSKYEGFPMTLIECQSFGCVPIIYDTYPAANEIVKEGENGILIPAMQKNIFIAKLKELMVNEDITCRLSANCINLMDRYSPNVIINEWINLIKLLSKTNS